MVYMCYLSRSTRHAPLWHPDVEQASPILFDAVSSRCVLSGPGTDGQRFAHASIVHTSIGREDFDQGITTAFWWRIVDEPNAFPPDFGKLFLQSSFTTLREKYWTVCDGMKWKEKLRQGLCGSGGRGWRRSTDR